MTRGGRGASDARFDAWGLDPDTPFPIRAAAGVLSSYLRLVYATARSECIPAGFHEEAVRSPGGTYIGVLWHRHIALPRAILSGLPGACMVSRSRDGELLARVMVNLGVRCVRGSSNSADGRRKGGAEALWAMSQAVEEGFHAVVTPDGPKGPPEGLKMGVVVLGANTGRPIVPMGFAASRYWRLSTWDGTVIPMPFTRVVLCYGEPLKVERTDDPAELERQRAELERRLLDANVRAQAELEKKRS